MDCRGSSARGRGYLDELRWELDWSSARVRQPDDISNDVAVFPDHPKGQLTPKVLRRL